MISLRYGYAASVMALFVTLAWARAADPVRAPTSAAGAETTQTVNQRSRSLSFDDGIVEGMNRNPMDSAESLAKRDGRDENHLYKKRTDFRKEMKVNIGEAGYSP